MRLERCLTYSNHLSLLTWNVNGLQWRTPQKWIFEHAFDFVILNENWSNSPDR